MADAMPVVVRPTMVVPVAPMVMMMTPMAVVVMPVMMMVMMTMGHGGRCGEHGCSHGHEREHRRLRETGHDVLLCCCDR